MFNIKELVDNYNNEKYIKAIKKEIVEDTQFIIGCLSIGLTIAGPTLRLAKNYTRTIPYRIFCGSDNLDRIKNLNNSDKLINVMVANNKILFNTIPFEKKCSISMFDNLLYGKNVKNANYYLMRFFKGNKNEIISALGEDVFKKFVMENYYLLENSSILDDDDEFSRYMINLINEAKREYSVSDLKKIKSDKIKLKAAAFKEIKTFEDFSKRVSQDDGFNFLIDNFDTVCIRKIKNDFFENEENVLKLMLLNGKLFKMVNKNFMTEDILTVALASVNLIAPELYSVEDSMFNRDSINISIEKYFLLTVSSYKKLGESFKCQTTQKMLDDLILEKSFSKLIGNNKGDIQDIRLNGFNKMLKYKEKLMVDYADKLSQEVKDEWSNDKLELIKKVCSNFSKGSQKDQVLNSIDTFSYKGELVVFDDLDKIYTKFSRGSRSSFFELWTESKDAELECEKISESIKSNNVKKSVSRI